MKFINLKALFVVALFSTLAQASQSPRTPQSAASSNASPAAAMAIVTPSPVQHNDGGGAAAAAAVHNAPAAQQVPPTPNVAQLGQLVDDSLEFDQDDALLPATTAVNLAQQMAANPEAVAAAEAFIIQQMQLQQQAAQGAGQQQGQVVYNMNANMKADGENNR